MDIRRIKRTTPRDNEEVEEKKTVQSQSRTKIKLPPTEYDDKGNPKLQVLIDVNNINGELDKYFE